MCEDAFQGQTVCRVGLEQFADEVSAVGGQQDTVKGSSRICKGVRVS